MLFLKKIGLVQFKNYTNRSFQFGDRITGICGNNGVGKTNLLDAIHYLCFTRSFFTRLDAVNVQHGSQGFRLEGEFIRLDEPETAVCILRENGRKEFSVNNDPYERFSQHIGRYPCVVIAPDDAELITGDSRERRSFLDAMLSQLDAGYLQHLINYRKILEQRNSLLKSFQETAGRNLDLLSVLDNQMLEPCTYIFEKRKEFLVTFLPQAKHLYLEISGQPEDINLFYESELLQAPISELLVLNRSRDLFSQRTTSGIHKDDLDIRLFDQQFRSLASQGQRKSLLFALKMAEMEVIRNEKKFAPILLLDDVFEKLDESRINNLLHKVCIENDGQVFITDTNSKRLEVQLNSAGIDHQMIIL